MQPLSPISVHERYSSPTAGSAKRRLFGEDPPKEILMDRIITEGTKLKIAPSSSITAENISISPGHSLLTMATAIVAGTTGHKVTIPLHGNILMHFFFFNGYKFKICLTELYHMVLLLLCFLLNLYFFSSRSSFRFMAKLSLSCHQYPAPD